jgi:hypothetical protein
LRRIAPVTPDLDALPPRPVGAMVADFMVATPVATLYTGGPPMPAGEPILSGSAKPPVENK